MEMKKNIENAMRRNVKVIFVTPPNKRVSVFHFLFLELLYNFFIEWFCLPLHLTLGEMDKFCPGFSLFGQGEFQK